MADFIKEKIKGISLKKGISLAKNSERRRFAWQLHKKGATIQELLNFVCSDSKIEIHKHPQKEKAEIFYVVKGEIKVFIYNDKGGVQKEYFLKAGDMAIAFPGEYHSLKAETEVAVVYIIITGKYNPKTHHVQLKKIF